jgi:hypothetical protein
MIIAFIDRRPPEFLNATTGYLLIVLSVLAYLMSPFCNLSRNSKDRVAIWSLVGVFVWWFIFQHHLVSLRPGITYYMSAHRVFSWTLNSGICFAFGEAYGIHLLRSASMFGRLFGILGTLLYGVLILELLLSPSMLRPALQAT